MDKIILVAGATGNLGSKITGKLVESGARVRVITREESNQQKIDELELKGVKVIKLNMKDKGALVAACTGASCVVSVLSGLADVIIDTQKLLVDAAVEANVPRFIPSDYSIDFTSLVPGQNRNLDLRREFHKYLDKKPIKSTTIFNGAFMDLITGEMPLILYKFKRILSWGKGSVKMDFTLTDDVAAYVARVAMDDHSPRYLRIAGDAVDPNDVKNIMTEITGKSHSIFKAGNIGRLNTFIRLARLFSKNNTELYPAWQGMQYMRDMMEGRAATVKHDNDRYPGMKWIGVKDYLLRNGIGHQTSR